MSLTNTAIVNAKPGPKPFKLFDERGLFLLVTPAGGKWWRFRYKFDGKEKLLSLGIYPDIPLACRTLKDEETGKAGPWRAHYSSFRAGRFSMDGRPSHFGCYPFRLA
jgi:hypothetical protein